MSTLRQNLIKLANTNPELRQHIVPLLRQASEEDEGIEAGREHGQKGKGYGGDTVRGPGKWQPEAKGKCFYETGDEADRCYVTENGGPKGQKSDGPKTQPGNWKDYEKKRWE